MQEADLEGWRRDQLADHELPAISGARNAAWSLREAPPAQNLPGRGVSVALVAVAALQSVLTSGIVFGWAPLQLMLQAEGVYGDACRDGPPCQEQAVSCPFTISLV
jgi:hypothetical protein